MGRKRLGQAQWRKIVSDYEFSELSQRAFAEQKGVPFYTFKDWLRRIRKESRESTPSFVDVSSSRRQVVEPSDLVRPRITLETPQGLRCILEDAPTSETLRFLIHELSRSIS